MAPPPAVPAAVTLPPPAALTTLPSISDLVKRVNPTVASISVESVTRGVFFDFNDEGAGSGVVIRDDGYIVTNYHVVQNADEIAVSLPSGDTYTAKVVGQDLITDLAVIKVDTEDSLPTAELVDSDALNVGDWVIAVGNALALKGGPTVTLGIISAKGRTIDTQHGVLYDMIQTDAAINDGNSGGPVVNMDGEVIGISTAIYRQAQGIGFAVSSSVAAPIIESLIEHGRVVRPLIGLSGTDVTPVNANRLGLPVDEGIIVTRMARDGPAARAGLRVNDVVIKMDGIPTPRHGQIPHSPLDLRRRRHRGAGVHQRRRLRRRRGAAGGAALGYTVGYLARHSRASTRHSREACSRGNGEREPRGGGQCSPLSHQPKRPARQI